MFRNRWVLVVAVVLTLALSAWIGAAGLSTDDGQGNRLGDETFVEVSGKWKLNYSTTNRGTENGGVYVADYDRDGWPDVLLLGGERPRLYSNTGTEFRRSDALPLLNESLQFKAAVFFDYDNDGWTDLLLLPEFASPVFLENEGGQYVQRDAGFDVTLGVPKSACAIR